jgi:sugar phosphate isomerase/epimerase
MHHPASTSTDLTRRKFLAQTGLISAALLTLPMANQVRAVSDPRAQTPLSAGRPKLPIGIELYAVRTELLRDLPGTLTALAHMGYEAVEFYDPYFKWTPGYVREVRARLDDLGLRCYSTHNRIESFVESGLDRAIELNQILGASHVVLATPPKGLVTEDDWKMLCAQLTSATRKLESHGMTAGFHNHQTEWASLGGGPRIMDLIAAHTPDKFVLQLDVGTCIEGGADPVAWIKAHPGRIKSVHLKDWAPGTSAEEKGYRVLFGEGISPWRDIMTALESVGGLEFYLMEQEGSRFSEMETARRCLETWKQMERTT